MGKKAKEENVDLLYWKEEGRHTKNKAKTRKKEERKEEE